MAEFSLKKRTYSWGINHSKNYSIDIEKRTFVVVENNNTIVNRALSDDELEGALNFLEQLIKELPQSGDFGFDAPTFEVLYDGTRLVKGIADIDNNPTYKMFYDFFESFIGK